MAQFTSPQPQPLVEILLSVYNGARFISEQLDSILGQTWKPLHLYIRDDGSQDHTWSILEDYAASYPQQITISRGENIGIRDSYLALLRQSSSEFVALADSDDVWLPGKISRAMAHLQEANEPDRPLFYSSRATITDQELRPAGMSLLRSTRLFSFANALVECPVHGATMVMNRAAREVICAVSPVEMAPQVVNFQDWWCYIVVTACGGRVIYDPRPSMLYRQHSDNTTGMPSTWFGRFWIRVVRRIQGTGSYGKMIPQARAIKSILGDRLSADDRWRLEQLINSNSSVRAALRCILGRAVYRQSWLDNLALLLLMLLRRPI